MISFQERQWGWKSVPSWCRPPVKSHFQMDRCPALSWLTHYQHLIMSSESKRKKKNLKPTTLISTILSRQTKEQDCVWTVGRWRQVWLPLIIQRTRPTSPHSLFAAQWNPQQVNSIPRSNWATCDIGSHFLTSNNQHNVEMRISAVKCFFSRVQLLPLPCVQRLNAVSSASVHYSSTCFSCSFVAASFRPRLVTPTPPPTSTNAL